MWPRGDNSSGVGGDITSSRKSRSSGLSGFVQFMKRKDAENCVREMDGFDWGGSVLRVGWSKAVPLAPRALYGESPEQPTAAHVLSFIMIMIILSNAQREPDQGAPQKKSDDIATDAPNHIQDPVLDPVPRAGTVTAAVQEIDTTDIPTATAIANVNVIQTTGGAVILDRAVIRVPVLLIPTVIIDTTHLDTTITIAVAAVRTRDLPPDTAEGHIVAAAVVIDEVPVETSILKPE
jgi:hypothetical protein